MLQESDEPSLKTSLLENLRDVICAVTPGKSLLHTPIAVRISP